jgi:hypothetical protein
MSRYLQNQVCDNADAGFYASANEIAVMRALVSFADDDGGSCFPALLPKKREKEQGHGNEEQDGRKKSLVERSGLCRTTVKKVLRAFQERKWIKIKRTGRSNHYQILPHGCLVPLPSGKRRSPNNPLKVASRLSEGRQPSLRRSPNDPYSYQELLSDTLHQDSSPLPPEGADTPRGVDGNRKEVTTEETFSLVTSSFKTARDASSVRPAARRRHMDVRSAQQPVAAYEVPSLEEICIQTRKLGLPDSDAHHQYKEWRSHGFELKGCPIMDWAALLKFRHSRHWFPSQRRKAREAAQIARIKAMNCS